jgi:hypothetical protein
MRKSKEIDLPGGLCFFCFLIHASRDEKYDCLPLWDSFSFHLSLLLQPVIALRPFLWLDGLSYCGTIKGWSDVATCQQSCVATCQQSCVAKFYNMSHMNPAQRVVMEVLRHVILVAVCDY